MVCCSCADTSKPPEEVVDTTWTSADRPVPCTPPNTKEADETAVTFGSEAVAAAAAATPGEASVGIVVSAVGAVICWAVDCDWRDCSEEDDDKRGGGTAELKAGELSTPEIAASPLAPLITVRGDETPPPAAPRSALAPALGLALTPNPAPAPAPTVSMEPAATPRCCICGCIRGEGCEGCEGCAEVEVDPSPGEDAAAVASTAGKSTKSAAVAAAMEDDDDDEIGARRGASCPCPCPYCGWCWLSPDLSDQRGYLPLEESKRDSDGDGDT